MNQYRCETCKYFKNNDCFAISNYGVWLSSEEYDMVKTVGCASHSDFPQRGCMTCQDTDCIVLKTADQTCWKGDFQNQREKVLDELSRAFIGKTESEIKDIMFFKQQEHRQGTVE